MVKVYERGVVQTEDGTATLHAHPADETEDFFEEGQPCRLCSWGVPLVGSLVYEGEVGKRVPREATPEEVAAAKQEG